MRRILGILVALILAIASLAQDCEFLYTQSLKLYDKKDYLASLTMLDSLSALCTPTTTYYIHRAKCCQSLNADKSTLEALNAAILLDDKCVAAWAMKAQFEFDKGMRPLAIASYEKLLSLIAVSDSSVKIYQTNLSALYVLTNQNDKAFEFLWDLCHHNQTDIQLLTNLSACAIYTQRFDEAEWALNKILDIDKKNIMGLTNLGLCKSEKQDYKGAIRCYNRSLRIQLDAYPLNNRGYAYYMLGKYDEALKDINLSLQLDASNSYAYKNRALVYFKLQKSEACNDLQTAIDKGFTKMYGDEVLKLQQEHCK